MASIDAEIRAPVSSQTFGILLHEQLGFEQVLQFSLEKTFSFYYQQALN